MSSMLADLYARMYDGEKVQVLSKGEEMQDVCKYSVGTWLWKIGKIIFIPLRIKGLDKEMEGGRKGRCSFFNLLSPGVQISPGWNHQGLNCRVRNNFGFRVLSRLGFFQTVPVWDVFRLLHSAYKAKLRRSNVDGKCRKLLGPHAAEV